MPKAWSDEEKEAVKQSLIESGRKLFEKHGLRKTTVDEIAKASHISKGAFYLFHNSKEELYFEILEITERDFKQAAFRNLELSEMSRRDTFKAFLKESIAFLTTMPIYKQISSGDLQYLMRKLPKKALDKHMRSDLEYFSQYLQPWIDKGWMRKVDPDALNGLFLSVVYFVVHRNDIGASSFEATEEILVDMIAEYLIPEE